MVALEPLTLLLFWTALLLVLLAALFFLFAWILGKRKGLWLHRISKNPILRPVAEHWWESEAVFNPAAFVHGGRVHVFYRALGGDGVSRIGYASSPDGIHFDERYAYPAYDPSAEQLARAAASRKTKKLSYATLSYDTVSYGSGGGWGGSEDPRAVVMDDQVYLTFTSFEGWNNERIALSQLPLSDFERRQWLWSAHTYLSPPSEVQKNWLLFPEKVNGKYAVLHSITPQLKIEYVDSLDEFDGTKFITGSVRKGGRNGKWDTQVLGAGAPPMKTTEGWLLLYHGRNPGGPGYQVGAMLLDLNDPTRVLYRSEQPILSPDEWYENDWKAGVVYATGAVIFNGDLLVYYGGGDKYVAAARMPLEDFLYKLMHDEHAVLTPVKV